MRVFLTACAAALFFAAPSGAVVIEPGKIYQGDFVADASQTTPSTCCPVLSIDEGPLLQRFEGVIGVDGPPAPGASFRLSLFDAALAPLSVTDVPINAGTLSLAGFGAALGGVDGGLSPQGGPTPASGFVQIEAFGDSFDLASLLVVSLYQATVDFQGDPLVTRFLGKSPIINITEILTDPPMTPVPLPAPVWLLAAALTGLYAAGRRRA